MTQLTVAWLYLIDPLYGRCLCYSPSPPPPSFLQRGVADRKRKEERKKMGKQSEKYSVSLTALSANMYITLFLGCLMTLVFSAWVIYNQHNTHTTQLHYLPSRS